MTPNDILGGVLPTVLPGTGVHVTVGNLPATIYYVSVRDQNRVLRAGQSVAGPSTVQVVLDGHSGPAVKIMLATPLRRPYFNYRPELWGCRSTRRNEITPQAPAKPGEIIPPRHGSRPDPAACSIRSVIQPGSAAGTICRFPTGAGWRCNGSGAVAYAGIAPGFRSVSN